MNLFKEIQATTIDLEKIVSDMAGQFPAPWVSKFGDEFKHRHHPNDRSDILVSFLKIIRVMSLLNASLELIKLGYVQETYILCRSIDEANEDIHFLAARLGEGENPSDDQKQMIADFFQEILEDPTDPLIISKYKPVLRSRIREELSKLDAGFGNSARINKTAKAIYRVFSGFAHGSYVAIMELWGNGFHIRGMLGTPRIEECVQSFSNNVYRSILALIVISSRIKRPDLMEKLELVRIRFAEASNCVADGVNSKSNSGE